MTAGEAIFGIEKSVSGARWVPTKSALTTSQIDRHAAALVETIDDLPLPIARIMASRGLNTDIVDAYLEPRLRDLLPNPSHFKDLDKAADRLADCVEDGSSIGIFGDYDVDGACRRFAFSSDAPAGHCLRCAYTEPIQRGVWAKCRRAYGVTGKRRRFTCDS